MTDGRLRTGQDTPDDPDLPQRSDQRPSTADDLRQRLDRMADGHPSSAGYATADAVPRRSDQVTRADMATPTRVEKSGWQASDVRGHPDLPALDDIKLTADRARHILDGDGPGTPGGGHRHGTARPRKTEFLEAWTDEKIVSTIQDVVRNPDEAHWQVNGRWLVAGERETVRVTAVVLPDGRIWTAWPEPGHGGVTENQGLDEHE